MTNFTKTIKLRLREPNSGKKESLDYLLKQSGEVARKTAELMPSIPPYRYDNPMDSVYYGWVKQFRENGIKLHAQTVQEIVQKVRSNYLTWWNGDRKERPMPVPEDHSWTRFHNRQIEAGKWIFEADGTYYIDIPVKARERITLPFYPGDYQNYFLERLVNKDLDHGAGELKKYGKTYYLNLSIKKPVDLDYEPKTHIGVDVGLNVLAWAVALDEDKEFLDEIHFDGKEAGHIRRRYQKLRDSLNASKNLKKEKKIGNREQRWMENKNHTVSRRIVDFADQFDNPEIILENINLSKMRKRVDDPKIHSWRAGDLRDMIIYKANEKGIRTQEINPKNTSRKCPECGFTSGENREGINFECKKCGYTNHADLVGARNIAVTPTGRRPTE